jgi:hypothetical protein
MDKTFYTLLFKQEAAAAPVTAHFLLFKQEAAAAAPVTAHFLSHRIPRGGLC